MNTAEGLRIRIAILVGGFPVVSETFITNQVVGLIEAGHDVRVYARRPNTSTEATPVYRGVDLGAIRKPGVIPPGPIVQRIGRGLVFSIRAMVLAPVRSLRVFWQIISEPDCHGFQWVKPWLTIVPFLGIWRPDVLHCHFGTNGLLGARLVATGAISAPLVVTFHGHDVHAVPRRRGSDVYTSLFATASAITANTSFTASGVQALGCPNEKIRIIPMGFFAEMYRAREKGFLSSSEGLSVLIVARLVEKKGTKYAIEAVAILKDQGFSVHLRIAGDGELRAELEGLIESLKVSDEVELLGWQSSECVVELMRSADVVLLPSVTSTNGDMEGQALVLQEAQAVGTPVVSTRHNGIPEGVVDGQTGILVDERDAKGIADALRQFARSPVRLKTMSTAAMNFARVKYDQTSLTESWERQYWDIRN